MKILIESIQDIENYLSNQARKDLEELFGKHLEDYGEDVLYQIIDTVEESFGEDNSLLPKINNVVICKVQGDTIDIVDPDHEVIYYNGYYYDYLAQLYSDLFKEININTIPVVQKKITSDNQINERLSSVKGYVMLGNK